MKDISKAVFKEVISVGYQEHMDYMVQKGRLILRDGKWYSHSLDGPFGKNPMKLIEVLHEVIENKILVDLHKVAVITKRSVTSEVASERSER